MAKGKIEYELIVIGGSAGSVDVILNIIPQLPGKYPQAVVVVLHRKATEEDVLLKLLQNKSILNVKEAEGNEPILPGVVYLAPPDYHLLIEDDRTFTLDFSEKVHYSRPSIDATMQSAADAYGNKLIGILVTGANEDGAIGMQTINDKGGHTIIQDPATAQSPTMPLAAIKITNSNIMGIPGIIRFLILLNNK